MASKYYWLKLKRDFFNRHDIKILKHMDNGEKYVIFYQQLLLESITHDGELRFSDMIPYDEKTLGILTDTDIDVVRSAMKVLVELEMIQILDDATIYMTECMNMVGTDTSIERVRKHREKKKIEKLESVTNCNVTDTLQYNSNSNSNSLSVYNSNNNYKTNEANIIPPTLQMVKAYCILRNNGIDAEYFWNWYNTRGWKTGKDKMKDWHSAIFTWEKNNNKNKTKEDPTGINWFEVE